MKNFFKRLGESFQTMYGVDQLGRFLLILAIIFVVGSSILGQSSMYIINVVLLTFAMVRVFSHNYSARLEENDKYLDIRNRVLGIFNKNAAKKVRNSDYKYFRCPSCNQMVRVPKGKGNISVKCPKCKSEFVRRS